MIGLLARRLGLGLATIGGVYLVTFLMVVALPGDPMAQSARTIPPEAQQAVVRLTALPIVHVHTDLVLAAISASQRQQISFWDSLIVQAALNSGCERLLTEDMQHGREIESLRIENPFLPA